MSIKRSILLRVRIAFLVVSLFALALFFRMAEIQFIEGEKWKAMAEEINLQYKTIPAVRGNIYAEDGSLLATSLPFYRVAFDPSIASDELMESSVDSLSMLLSRFFGDHSPVEYKRRILNARAKGRQYLILNREKINYLAKKEMERWPVFRKGKYGGGVIFEKVNERYKPFSFLGARTIGHINENSKGAGLEYSFNEHLAGRDGKGLFQKMAGSYWKPIYDGTQVKPVAGYDIVSTIDVNIQDVAQSSLMKALIEHEADYGAAVVMEVKTGEVKAISNLTRYQNGNYGESYNHAVGGLTEPGSTFKLASVIALMEEAHLNLNDSIDAGDGKYEFYDRVMTDHEYGGYGMISFKDAFSHSSNIAISRWVNHHFGLKPERFVNYIQSMGLADRVGFQIKGEGMPYIKLPGDKSWSGVSLPWMSIGYELKLTPIQVLAFYNAVANDGKMIQPIIVKSVKQADKEMETYESGVLNEQICSRETLEKVKVMLESVVEEGTASNIKNSYYKIAGKTGTAQKLKNGRYIRQYYTSFVGYFPADAPKYSCIVVIDDPKGFQRYASSVAAPVFKNIADKIYATDLEIHESLPKQFVREEGVFPVIQAGRYDDLQTVMKTLQIEHEPTDAAEWVRAQRAGNKVNWKESSTSFEYIPDVRGMTMRDAIFLLENRGLRVNYQGNGRVLKQSQQPGNKVIKGSKINLQLG
ncbi:cell division protein FtsI (penicillin-binding protein 3) [Catalinimonas alkaloidigena]|uniref:penicillin-binding protein n=1 Tax=Catalinimonas alkaloidigena TaxID=1075417 RepID=UPI002406C5E3|nr:penicillin-binding protein [Catalinimonas alkaloidigena]MDF9801237.1 cell division protein FtsI (penicillin-binding protein 3) [Catalinimonas alkaloidigena]